MTYACLPGNQIKVTVDLFSDCSATGQIIGTTLDIKYISTTCADSGIGTIPLLSGSGVEIQAGNYPPCGATACNGGTAYGIKKYTYEGIFTVPQACSDWKLSCELINRNGMITTVNSAQLYSIYLEAFLDNLNYPTNTSPVFGNDPVSLTCLNENFNYSGNATDAESDSLAFSFISTRGSTGPGSPVVDLPYASGFSATNPLASVSGVNLDGETGLLSFVPDQLQVGVVAIRIDEYRNGVLIGSVMRDMQINVQALCNIIPELRGSTMAAVFCNDSILDLQLNQLIQCSSLNPDGSDFRLLAPGNTPVPVVVAVAIGCSSGLTDHLQLTLNSRMTQNGTYYLWTKRGNDLNTLLNRCGNEMAENDTLPFAINNCFSGITDLLNVSVNVPNDAMEVTWAIPSGVDASNFVKYTLYRSDLPAGPYLPLATATNVIDTFYTDLTANVAVQPYNYAVTTELNTGFITPLSDTIQSIFLRCTDNSDSLTMELNWTPYWGWSNPVYEVLQLDSAGATFVVAGSATSGTSYHYQKPVRNGLYHVRIRSSSQGSPELVSLSNWCEFRVLNTEVVVPNVFTPNHDAKNEYFEVKNLEQYPNSKLSVYDRWGKEVYRSENYRNDWNGGDLKDGTYFYILKINDAKASEFRGAVSILRNTPQ